MYRHELLRDRVLEALEQTPDGLSQLALMCECHGYRYAHQKLLFFSVEERSLKQERRFEEVTDLLEAVIAEADEEHEARVEKSRKEEERRRRRAEKLKAYDFTEPPAEIVVRPASRRLVSGSPLYSYDTVFGRLSDHQRMQAAVTGLDVGPRSILTAAGLDLSRFSASSFIGLAGPPQYEVVPEERAPSEYSLLNADLERKLEQYPKVVWQKLETERRFADDETVRRRVQVARQATRRALLKLTEEGRVTVEGKRLEATYYLANNPA